MDILIVGICRSILDKGGLVNKPCFRRRENFKACRTLVHAARDGEASIKKKTMEEYFY